MKKIVITYMMHLLCFQFLYSQNRIEIYVNDTLKPLTNEVIRVKNFEDKIEYRIYGNNNNDLTTTIDSIVIEGCYYLQNQVQEQRQSPISNSTRTANSKIKTSKYPNSSKNYISFEFYVSEITYCKGKYFYLQPFYGSKSNLKNYIGYNSKYKFYLVR